MFIHLEHQNKEFVIERPEKYGGKISFKTYDDVEKAFASKELSSIDLKGGISSLLIEFLAPLQETLNENRELYEKGYL